MVTAEWALSSAGRMQVLVGGPAEFVPITADGWPLVVRASQHSKLVWLPPAPTAVAGELSRALVEARDAAGTPLAMVSRLDR